LVKLPGYGKQECGKKHEENTKLLQNKYIKLDDIDDNNLDNIPTIQIYYW